MTLIGKNIYPINLESKKQTHFLVIFKKWVWIVILISSMFQIIFEPEFRNIFAIFCILSVWRLTDIFILNKSILNKYTISSILILGYSITQYLFPIFFTLIEGKVITSNLDHPVEVFVHSTLAFLTFLSAHIIYTRLGTKESLLYKKIQSILSKLSLYKTPSDSEIWLVGLIGLAGLITNFWVNNHYSTGNDSERSIGEKLFQGLSEFAYTPFLLLLKPIYSNSTKLSRLSTYKIISYALVLILVGVGGNSRGMFMSGIANAILVYFTGLLIGKFDIRKSLSKLVIYSVIGIWLITGPLADLGTAMVLVRSQRGTITNSELVAETLDSFQDKKSLRAYQLLTNNSKSKWEWDESYFDNIFLARFCNLKFNDSNLKNSILIGEVDPEMRDYSIARFWAILPQPFLSLFSIKIDKDKIIKSSFGDFLYSRAGGGSSVLGGFRTGHFSGTGMSAFGWSYLIIIFIVSIPIYYLFDLLLLSSKSSSVEYQAFSFIALLNIYHVFIFLGNSESVINYYAFILRGWGQMIILYLVLFKIANKIKLLF